MMKVYFRNYKKNIGVSLSQPLEGSIWQVLDIFENLPEDDGSFLGLMDAKGESIRFMKYNKFVWLVEIPQPELGGAYEGYFTKRKCKELIQRLFSGMPLNNVQGLNFEKYL